jgi:Holliday junction resolvase
MTNRQKQKGDRAERAFVNWLNGRGFTARRTRAGWDDDKGDINLSDTRALIDVKDRKELRVNEWMDSLYEKLELFEDFDDAMLVVKRPGQGDPGKWWVIRRAEKEFGDASEL